MAVRFLRKPVTSARQMKNVVSTRYETDNSKAGRSDGSGIRGTAHPQLAVQIHARSSPELHRHQVNGNGPHLQPSFERCAGVMDRSGNALRRTRRWRGRMPYICHAASLAWGTNRQSSVRTERASHFLAVSSPGNFWKPPRKAGPCGHGGLTLPSVASPFALYPKLSFRFGYSFTASHLARVIQ